MLKFVNNLLMNLPTSKNLTFKWNFGSMLGMVLVFQIVSGVLLVFYYSNDSLLSFSSIQFIMNETSVFTFIRILHFNGVSLFFVFLYLHIFKGLFFFSYKLEKVWLSGLTIYLLVMAEAFMGYAMVWAQMSYWACVVITSLLMVVPIFGEVLVGWIWNSFNIWNATLKLLFIVHFLLPFVILIFMIVHLMFLHETGSSSSIYSFDGMMKLTFFKFYWLKDSLNLFIWLLFFFLSFIFPFSLGDPEMFIDVDLNMSPAHIVPEWYFLFAYAILRAIPNKFLGVVALIMSIFLFYLFVFCKSYLSPMNKFNKMFMFFFIFVSVILSWLGQCFVEYPFPFLSSVFSILYFFLIFILFMNNILLEKVFK